MTRRKSSVYCWILIFYVSSEIVIFDNGTKLHFIIICQKLCSLRIVSENQSFSVVHEMFEGLWDVLHHIQKFRDLTESQFSHWFWLRKFNLNTTSCCFECLANSNELLKLDLSLNFLFTLELTKNSTKFHDCFNWHQSPSFNIISASVYSFLFLIEQP